MMAKVSALVYLLVVFLPFIVKAGEPEPYVEVAVYSTQGPESPPFEGFTDGRGYLRLGLFVGLPQRFYVELKRDRVDGVLQRTLPLVVSDAVKAVPRGELWCHATYNWDSEVNEVHCYGWSLFAETAPTERE